MKFKVGDVWLCEEFEKREVTSIKDGYVLYWLQIKEGQRWHGLCCPIDEFLLFCHQLFEEV